MKKALFLLFVSIFILTGCGSNELKQFVDDFNEVIENEDIDELNPDNFGELEESEEDDEEFKWRELYESDRYIIEAEYGDGKNLSGYFIHIDPSEPYKELEGKGYRASVSIAKALGLSSSSFSNSFKTALTEDTHSYSENGYEIRFLNIGWDSSIDTGISVTFEEK